MSRKDGAAAVVFLVLFFAAGTAARSQTPTSEIRTVCPACNFAGHERIVICR